MQADPCGPTEINMNQCGPTSSPYPAPERLTAALHLLPCIAVLLLLGVRVVSRLHIPPPASFPAPGGTKKAYRAERAFVQGQVGGNRSEGPRDQSWTALISNK